MSLAWPKRSARRWYTDEAHYAANMGKIRKLLTLVNEQCCPTWGRGAITR